MKEKKKRQCLKVAVEATSGVCSNDLLRLFEECRDYRGVEFL